MAGGVGSRFWPLSKSTKPKQFLDIMGVGKTFIQLTYERMKSICPDENFLIVTNKIYKGLVLEQLPMLKEDQVLLEPMRRNTAPCIAYANYEIQKRCKNANIIVSPADHVILDQEEFVRVIKSGLDIVSKRDVLLTLGIKPCRPDTGYGYIQMEKDSSEKELFKVRTFTEKPNLEVAKFFFESGEFFWNSGIFLWSLNSINKAFEEHLPEVFNLFNNREADVSEGDFVDKTYSACPNISIDYGVMEKAKNVYVYKSDFGWSDLGTWGSLYENSRKDDQGNALICKDALIYESKNCIVNIPGEKLLVAQGLDGFIIVDSGESLLICKKEEEQRIRQFVNDIQLKKGEKYI